MKSIVGARLVLELRDDSGEVELHNINLAAFSPPEQVALYDKNCERDGNGLPYTFRINQQVLPNPKKTETIDQIKESEVTKVELVAYTIRRKE